jgi:outer membrane protein TolC
MSKQILGSAIMFVVFACRCNAVTLQDVLDTTVEKNPAILEAKANLEQAAGQRLVLRSVAWPNARVAVPAGVQGGKRPGGRRRAPAPMPTPGGTQRESRTSESTKVFGFARGWFTQPLFNAAIPPSLRRGDVDLLIAKQQLNLMVAEQLHAARLAFYAALYNRALQSLREDQRHRLEQNSASQKDRYETGLTDRSAFVGATIQVRELDPKIESVRRAYGEARLRLAQAMDVPLGADISLPDAEGELQFVPVALDLSAETTAALERRVDLKLARLFTRVANEDLRIIEAGYYPLVNAFATGHYVPVTGIHREGSTRRTDDFITSEVRGGAAYTWRVIDTGKVTGAVRQQRAVREINELTCRKLEANVSRELLRIHNNLLAIQARHDSLASAAASAEEGTRIVAQNLTQGLASQLEYRVTQTGYLETRSGLLESVYQYNVALAESDRATGRYFQFSDEGAR